MKIGLDRSISRKALTLTLLLTCALTAGRTQALDITTAGSGLWTNPATWSPSQVPGIGDNVTLASGHTNIIQDAVSHDVANLTIQTNALLTHATNSTTALGERYKIILNIAGALTIDAGGQINADGRGYATLNNAQGSGPGAPVGASGASHGGRGIRSVLGPLTYGSVTAPTNLGSGGYYTGLNGGGAIRLSVGGTATVNGTITATGKGALGSGTPFYSGSGGSVFLTVGSLVGNGVLRANGDYGTQGSGGGGRVAVILTGSTSFDNVKFEAYAGSNTVAANGGQAAGGTVYLEQSGQGRLIVDYNNLRPDNAMLCNSLQNGMAPSSYSFTEIVLTNNGVYALDTNDTLDITSTVIKGDPTNLNDGIWLNGGTLTAPSDFAYSNFFIGIASNSAFFPASSLTVGTNAALVVNVPFTSSCPITIQAGASMSHAANDTEANGERYKINVTVPGNLTIDAGGQINVDGKGYASQQGPGKPITANGRAGGSYGGIGGVEQGYPGTTYGSITSPTNLGSASTGATNAGGGAIQLTVAGTATVNGVISASGGTVNYGSSGGSVFLTAGWLSGTGMVRANGGTNIGQYATGGGGRVAVILTGSTDFASVKIQAFSPAGVAPGAGGTVYQEHMNHTPGQGRLIVDYNDVIPLGRNDNYASSRVLCTSLQNGYQPSSYAFSEIILTNGGVYALDTNDTLTLTSSSVVQGDKADRNEGILISGGTLVVPAGFTYSNYYIGVNGANSTFTPTPSLAVGTNASLKINTPFTLNCPLTIEPGGILDHSPNITNEVCKINLTINGNFLVQTGGQVNVDGCGFSFANGPGKPVASTTGAGGSYGGVGGNRTAGDIAGLTYGSITSPTNLGSGGNYGVNAGDGSGGGAVKLDVNGTTTLQGLISASPNSTIYGGSGGSIFLTTGSLEGNGTVQAGGLYASWMLGAGGRVAVILTNGNDFGQVAIQSIASRNESGCLAFGGAGTVYLQTKDQGAGQGSLWIDASNRPSLMPTLISSNVTGTAVGSVIITNGAVLHIGSNQTLTVNGNWDNKSIPVNTVKTNASSFAALTNSTVILAGTNMATVSGSNAFFNLSCSNALKTVRFTAGSTNRVAGMLAVGGGVTLRSTVDNAWWYLALAPGGSQQIGLVKVKDSNASDGQPLAPQKFSDDQGNNINWLFIKSTGMLIQIR